MLYILILIHSHKFSKAVWKWYLPCCGCVYGGVKVLGRRGIVCADGWSGRQREVSPPSSLSCVEFQGICYF